MVDKVSRHKYFNAYLEYIKYPKAKKIIEHTNKTPKKIPVIIRANFEKVFFLFFFETSIIAIIRAIIETITKRNPNNDFDSLAGIITNKIINIIDNNENINEVIPSIECSN